jgi:hypothetical protein
MPVSIELNEAEKEQYQRSHRISATLKAGLLAGAIVWLFPGGNPWTSFLGPVAPRVMGRPISADQSITFFSLAGISGHVAHFAASIACAFVLLAIVYRLHSWKAVVAGMIGGLALYGINFGIVRLFVPQLAGAYEFNVALAHVLFGAVAAGAIRGFLRPPQKLDPTKSNPGPVYP